MFKKQFYFLLLCLIAAPVFADEHSSEQNNIHYLQIKHHVPPRTILEFNSMYGVDGPFLSHEVTQPSDPKIRGIIGDYSPWKIGKSTKGALFSDGTLFIKVRRLVFTNEPNDEENFRALVSCLTFENNLIVEKNVITGPFPTGGPQNDPALIGYGNANIKAHVSLPQPCIAPIIMILNGDKNEGDLWFATTGS
jgi:hypothetical protein